MEAARGQGPKDRGVRRAGTVRGAGRGGGLRRGGCPGGPKARGRSLSWGGGHPEATLLSRQSARPHPPVQPSPALGSTPPQQPKVPQGTHPPGKSSLLRGSRPAPDGGVRGPPTAGSLQTATPRPAELSVDTAGSANSSRAWGSGLRSAHAASTCPRSPQATRTPMGARPSTMDGPGSLHCLDKDGHLPGSLSC